MSITLTCAALVSALAAASGGETLTLAHGSDCPKIVIKRVYAKPLVINAGASIVRGVQVLGGGNVRWRSGKIVAPAGLDGFASDGYGAYLRGATNVRIDGVEFSAAKKAVTIDGSTNVTIADSRFIRYREDGVIATRTTGLVITRNRFAEMMPLPTSCTMPTGEVVKGLAARDCKGTFADGNHADAIQAYNGIVNAIFSYNDVSGDTMGIDQNGGGVNEKVVIEHNRIVTAQYHQITLYDCRGCAIRWNEVRHSKGSKRIARIQYQPGTLVCGNTVPDYPQSAGGKCEAVTASMAVR